MRNSSGEAMMPLWKYDRPDGACVVAGWTRKEAFECISKTNCLFNNATEKDLTRLKNCFGYFKTARVLSL